MSSDIRRGGLAAEKVALDIYLDSLYEEVPNEEGSGAPVITLVPEMTRPVSEKEQGPRQGELLPRHACESVTFREEQESDEGVLRLLLFRLCGLCMAVPAADLERTVDWPAELAPAPGDGGFCLGVLEEGARRIPVMDLAGLVVPQRLRSRRTDGEPTQILIAASGSLGLACHGVEGVVSVDHDAVNWRAERTSRKWLAGTIPEHGSALLDIAALQVLLQGGGSGSGIV